MATKENNWQRLVDQVTPDDGLAVRESGYWAEKKLYFWNRYIDITTTAMVGDKWPHGLVYVDLFSGPGVCIDRRGNRKFPGSPIIAANAPKPFSKILLCDIDPLNADACRKRLDSTLVRNKVTVFEGDSNVLVSEIAQAIPPESLVIGFLDPTGLHVHMNTVKTLASRGPTDLLILFPDAYDIMRNADQYYFGREDSKLDLVLGSDSDWRKRKANFQSAEPSKLRKLYAEIYKDQLRKHCGFTHFGEEVIYGKSGPLYRLVYATGHELGLKFWNESVKKDAGGQSTLF